MSLFAGLFGSKDKEQGSSLFSQKSQFKAAAPPAAPPAAEAAHSPAAAAPAADTAGAARAGKKRKAKESQLVVDVQEKLVPSAEAPAKPSKKDKKGKDGARGASQPVAELQPAAAAPAAEDGPSKRQKRKAPAQKAAQPVEAVEPADTKRYETQAAADAELPEQDATPSKPKRTPEEEAERLQRTLFVGNLPVAIKPKELIRHFRRFGAVESARLRSVPVKVEANLPRRVAILTGKIDAEGGSANGYVVMEAAESVTAALAANMELLDGHHIRVDRAAPPAKAVKSGAASSSGGGAASPGGSSASNQYEPTRSVFVGNLSFHIKDEELISFFTAQPPPLGEGSLEAVRVVRDEHNHVGKGFAFVLFKTKAAARAALALDGQELAKRPLRISRVSDKAKAKTGKQAAGGKHPAGRGGASGLGVVGPQLKKAGVKSGAAAKLSGPVKSADWQGSKTKGKGKGLRTASKSTAASGGGASGKKQVGRGGGGAGAGAGREGGTRPAVAARKAKSQAKKAAKQARQQQG